MVYMAKILLEIGEVNESLFFSAPRIKFNSQNPILLYYEAKSFMELELYNYALITAKYACEFSPESTSTWTLLSRAYIYNKNYEYVNCKII